MSILVAPIEVLLDRRLTDSERRVLLALFSFRGKNTDIVWPSIKVIAERANINDFRRVSRLTKSLAEKGWLTKGRRGFTGGNKYSLCVPDIEDSNLVKDTNFELAESTNTNLAESTMYREQTTEQTTEQYKYLGNLNFQSWPELPAKQIWVDYKKLRSTKRAPITQTVIEMMGVKLSVLSGMGYTVDKVLSICVEKGWQGLEVDWITNIGGKSHGFRAGDKGLEREKLLEATSGKARNNW